MQNEMNQLFAEGGVMQEGGTVDPVSGNDVPPGAMQEEVRDDIDAKLSEGEFVFPADVVRYIGLETLMRLRDKAKTGLKKMEEIGQMGNAEEVPNAEALHGEGEMDEESFSSEIDSIMSEEGEREYAEGGYVGGAENQQMYSNAPMKGFEMVAMTNDEGQVIYIPFINGVAQLTIPPGYKVKSAAPTTPKPVTPTPTTPTTPTKATESTGSDSGSSGTPSRSVDDVGLATASTISPTGVKVGAMGLSLLTGLPISLIANLVGVNKIADYMNTKSYESAVDYNLDKVAEQLGLPNTPENRAALSAVVDSLSATNPNTPAATPGVGGTGGSAASAASAAASAATAAGHSPAAIAAAAQAAVDAVVSGRSASEAAQVASDAAATADGGTTGPGSAAGVGVGSTTGINAMDAMSDAASRDTTTSSTPSSTPTESTTSNTTESTTSTTSDSTTSDSTTSDSTTSDSTDSGGKSGDTAGFAKGGFVSKKKKTTKAPKPTSLVARRK